MNIHEYQAKKLLSQFDVTLPKGEVLSSLDQASEVFEKLFKNKEDSIKPLWVLKAQIHAGGRGKAGGVKLGRTKEEFEAAAQELFGKKLVTKQTGPEGKVVHRLYIEEASHIEKELYLSFLLDRNTSRISIVASQEGGMDIEEVATKSPDEIKHLSINPAIGWKPFYGRQLVQELGIQGKAQKSFLDLLGKLYKAYVALDASLIEINPLVITQEQHVIPLDVKMTLDDNALYRHPEIKELRDLQEEDPLEIEASNQGLNYVKLTGNIGCMVNGAGLAMATMDIIKLHGADPANFLDVGGGATEEMVSAAFKIILSDPTVKGILVNIFGGIMRCDVIADGIVKAAQESTLPIPLVVRLAGTNVEEGRQILESSSLPIIAASTLEEAAVCIVQAVQGMK